VAVHGDQAIHDMPFVTATPPPPIVASMRSCNSGVASNSRRRSLKSRKDGADRAIRDTDDSVSHCDRASVTTLAAQGLYSTLKSKPNSLLTHWCLGIAASF
jgi:hypothetical protein